MNTLRNSLKEMLLNEVSIVKVVKDINSWNGQLDWLDFIDMDLFDEFMEGQSPLWIAERIFYGDFNPNDEYFILNGYGNLESFDEWKANKECEEYIDEIIDALIDNIDYIDTYSEIHNLFEELEEEEEEEL